MKKYLIIFLLLIAIPSWGADTKISALSTVNPAAADLFTGLQGGVNVNFAWGANLVSLKGLTFADASILQLTGAGAAAVLTSGGNDYFLKSATDNSALMFATPAQVRTALGLVVGTNVQAYDVDHNTIAAGMVGLVKGAGNGAGYSAATAGVDYLAPAGSGAALTGITGAQIAPAAVQAVTCTDSGDGNHGALTITPTVGKLIQHINLTVADAHGCTITISETGAVDQEQVSITNISANHADFADQAGVLEMMGSLDLSQNETAFLKYANSQFYETGRSVASYRNLTFGGFTANRGLKTDASGNIVVTTLTDANLEDVALKGTDNTFTAANTIGDGGDDQRIVNRINATNERWSGSTLYFADCAASLTFGTPVYIQSTGKPAAADADAAATMPAIGLIVVPSVDADDACTVLTHGVITDTDWNFTTVGATIYTSETAGSVELDVANISDSNDVVQVLGIALHADTLFVNPSLVTIVLE